MLKIGVLSDTHGYCDNKITEHLSTCDEIWHAGDVGAEGVIEKLNSLNKPLRMVYGNIDGQEIRRICPKYEKFRVEGLKIFITHIGGKPGKYQKEVATLLHQEQPDIFVCGHSHILKIARDSAFNFLYLNPGAAGKQGFHTQRTMVCFTLDNRAVKDVRVIEMRKHTI